MSAIRSKKNQYPGINAHLHSYWQARGGWEEFHASYIIYLANALKAQLLPMGYSVGIQNSLQIRHPDERPIERPKSDVTIYDTDPERTRYSIYSNTIAAPVIAPLPEMVEEEAEHIEYLALSLRKSAQKEGDPVAWVELLSPSNKPGGQDAAYYADKRLKLLYGGIVFVEIDFLHEYAPTFRKIPYYPDNVKTPSSIPALSAYRIITIDPRPSFHSGNFYMYPTGVDKAIPPADLPLSGNEVLNFDFGVPYRKAIEESLFTFELVDYSQLPLNFNRYSEVDQARIVCRMLAVLKAAREGVDLESAEQLPVEDLPLEQALRELERIKT